MYLFQQAKDADTIISDLVIYIPLCIYFNYNVLNWPYAFYQIYIPLCIYFNALFLLLKNAVK